MLSPLKPLLCRHDFYWSERHLSERCRRCAKLRNAETVSAPPRFAAPPMTIAPLPPSIPAERVLVGFHEPMPGSDRSPASMRPDAGTLKSQDRRDRLPELLDRLAEGKRPTWEEAVDIVLALIEDAQAAEPVVFGAGAAGHFARLHHARPNPG